MKKRFRGTGFDKPRTKEQLLKEINDRIVYFYARIDGGFDFPNSRDGDLLKMVKKYIDMISEENKGVNEFIKVYSLSSEQQDKVAEITGSNKRNFVMRKYLGDIKDDDGIVLAEISTTLNGLNLLVEINGNIIGINSTAVIEHIVLNHLDYINAEFDKQIGLANGTGK